MKKVTAFIGTESKYGTYHAVQEFEKSLKHHGKIDFEYIFLSDHNIKFCKSCCQCFFKGEENCPLKDDRDKLLEKIGHSDGVIFATPNYAFQVSGRMKNFIDRMAFIYHRPRYFDKAFTGIVTQGVFGGNKILKYLYTTGESLGFHVSKGFCVTIHRPMTRLQQKKLTEEAKKASARFYKELLRTTPPPSFFRLILFRMARTSIKTLDGKYRDYQYYRDMGWFESDYYHGARLGIIKKIVGKSTDFIGRQMFKQQ